MKKIIAVILSIVMVMSVFAVSASAVSQNEKAQSKVEAAIENVIGAYVDAGEDAVITVDSGLAKKAVDENGRDITAGELSNMLANYVAVEMSDETKSVAEKIADECTYTVTVIDSGEKTVFILVDIAANPELFDYVVFHDAVMKMAENQKSVLTENDKDVTLMDYNRIAGELALHMIVFKTTKPLIGVVPEDSKIRDYYESAKVAELNINEDRAPESIMIFLGRYILEILYKLALIFK